MAQVTIITDTKGKLLGAVRTDSIQVGNTRIKFYPHPHEGHQHHTVEADDDLMRRSSKDVHKELLSKIVGQRKRV